VKVGERRRTRMRGGVLVLRAAMRLRFRNTVRWRLTLWYTLVLFMTFVIFGIVIDRLVALSLQSSMDRHLQDALGAVINIVNSSYREVGTPTDEYLREEFLELGLSAQLYLRLDMPGRGSFYFNERLLPENLLGKSPMSVGEKGRLETISAGGKSWRVLSAQGIPGFPCRILLGQDLAPLEIQRGTLIKTLLIVLPAILLVATAAGYILAGRALSPIVDITRQARHIEAQALQNRLEVADSGDEIGRLAEVLNDLFARLERSFQQQKQLLADAAHELRTPVAILRSQSEVALERERTADEYKSVLSAMRTEVEHLSSMVDDLLFIARAEADQLPFCPEPVDLVELVDESCRMLRPLIKSRNLSLEWQVGDEMTAWGDGKLLRRALMNLLANAVKFTPERGCIAVRVEKQPGQAVITISDTGRGVPAGDLPHIFDRFYRGAAPPDTDGSGLGLAIVKMIAELHGGGVSVVSESGVGSSFTVRIPDKFGIPATVIA
jgi:heavy metal sensor kinase